jgi:UDP-2,4-diacetamido-2,4,6-trideoxy-beta-L-altropyranose hydrolase
MKIAFRTDATNQIGTGHFIRCLTLADELKEQGAQICFISRNLPNHFRDMLAAKGMKLLSLINSVSAAPIDDLAHSAWLGISQAQDAQDTIQALAGQTCEWLVVDHYALDARWENAMRKTAKRIMVIDDLADRQHDCELLLDQNFYADMQTRYSGKVPAHCQLLLGPQYALLREEFRKLREQIKPRTGKVKKLLVFFGGVDADNYTGLAIKALADMALKEVHVDVVIGAQHPCRAEIETNCAALGFVCHVQTDKMAELMAFADLAIGAGGTATWERGCLGLPTYAICTADNQQRQVTDAAQEGLLYTPEISGDMNSTIQKHTRALIENSYLRQFFSKKNMQAIDGDGILRIIKKLDCTNVNEIDIASIDVRLAVINDALLVWPWRNHEATRRFFFDPTPVSWDMHITWWNLSLLNLQRVILLGRLNGKEVGVIRYDFMDSQQAKVSIYLNPEMTGRGLGKSLLRTGKDWLLQNYPKINTIVAEVMPKNIASLHVFLAAGFEEQHIVLSWKGN